MKLFAEHLEMLTKAGRAAHAAGVTLRGNPHERYSALGKAWSDGWLEADDAECSALPRATVERT